MIVRSTGRYFNNHERIMIKQAPERGLFLSLSGFVYNAGSSEGSSNQYNTNLPASSFNVGTKFMHYAVPS